MQSQPRNNNANRVNIANPTYQKCASFPATLMLSTTMLI